MKAVDQNLGLERGKLLGFEHLAEAGWSDSETAIGVAHNKLGGLQGEGTHTAPIFGIRHVLDSRIGDNNESH